MDPSPALSPPVRAGRLLSLDAYRGFAMFLMAAELLQGKQQGGAQDQSIARTLNEVNRKLDGLFDSLAMR